MERKLCKSVDMKFLRAAGQSAPDKLIVFVFQASCVALGRNEDV